MILQKSFSVSTCMNMSTHSVSRSPSHLLNVASGVSEEGVEVGEGPAVQHQLGLLVTARHYVAHSTQRWGLQRRGRSLTPLPLPSHPPHLPSHLPTYHTADLRGAQEADQSRYHARVNDGLDLFRAGISEVGEGPAGVTDHLTILMLDEVHQGRQDLGGGGGEKMGMDEGRQKWMCVRQEHITRSNSEGDTPTHSPVEQPQRTVVGSCSGTGWTESRSHYGDAGSVAEERGRGREGENPPEFKDTLMYMHVLHPPFPILSPILSRPSPPPLTPVEGLMRAMRGWMMPQRAVKSLQSAPLPAMLPRAHTAWSTTFMCSEDSRRTNSGTAPGQGGQQP